MAALLETEYAAVESPLFLLSMAFRELGKFGVLKKKEKRKNSHEGEMSGGRDGVKEKRPWNLEVERVF